MGFRFPLAAVLMVREHAEQREERALRNIQLQITGIHHHMEEVDAVIAQAQKARERALREAIPAFELQDSLRQSKAATDRKVALMRSLHTLTQELTLQMQSYRAAHRDREALTSMRDDQRAAWELEQARTAQKQLDDIFSARRHRG